MLVRRLLYLFALIISLASCAQRDSLALSMGAQSINYFNSGQPGVAEKLARRLWWFDRDSSHLLIGQYGIYKAVADGRDLSKGVEGSYRSILSDSMEIKNKDFYIWLVVANVFADRYLNGVSHARVLLATECQKYLSLDSSRCIHSMMVFHENSYRTTHEAYDALYAYEAAVIARDVESSDPKIASWLVAYPMVAINESLAGKMLVTMNERGDLTPEMKAAYCKFVKDDLRFRPALDCFQI